MAERRMFTKKITESDAFLDMPASTQALYFHLSMNADDEGFINAPKRIQRTVGASDDDMKILLAKAFIISFDTGIIVIKHWKMHNYIRNDRFKPTVYADEKALLGTKDNGVYTLGIPNGYQMDTQDSIGKDSIGNYIVEIINYLNDVCKTSYKSTSEKTKRCINARLAEGFTVDDFKKVIDNKYKAWHGTEYAQYLRPETLFGTKFEGYLNEKPKASKNANFEGRSYNFDELERSVKT